MSPHRIPEADAIVVMRAAGLEPLEPYPGSGEKWLCRCGTCDKQVDPTFSNVKMGRSGGCKWCARTAVDPNNAANTMRLAGLEPITPYPGSGKPWLCRCLRCTNTVSPHYQTVARGGGCRSCAGQVVAPSDAVAVMRAANLEPLEPYRNARHPWACRCLKCGRTVTPWYMNVRNGIGGCRSCAGQVVGPSYAVAVMRAADLEPLEPYRNAWHPWTCCCLKCGRTVTPLYTVVRCGGGCCWCATRGFKSTEAAIVYLLSHPTYRAAKVGITNNGNRRFKSHKRLGWQTVVVVRVPDGTLARIIEKEILDWWRIKLSLPPYLGRHEMPQGGWTETVDLDEIDLAATVVRIRSIAANGALKVA